MANSRPAIRNGPGITSLLHSARCFAAAPHRQVSSQVMNETNMKTTTPKITRLLKWSGKLIFSSFHSILVSVLLFLIGIPVLISWATGTLNILIETMKTPTPLWISIVLCLLLILYVYLKSRTTHPFVTHTNKLKVNISKTATDILVFFGNQDDVRLNTKRLSETFEASFNQTQYAIDQLLGFGFLCEIETDIGPNLYGLSAQGREFLGKKNLL